MNASFAPPALALLVFGLILTSPALDAAERSPLVEIKSVFIEAPSSVIEEALKVIPPSSDLRTVLNPAQWKQVRQFLTEHQTRIVAEPSLVTKSGQRGLAESVRELRFPSKHVESKSEPGNWIPTDFETRNIGVTLEVESVVGPDDAIGLQIFSRMTEFLGFIDYTAAKEGKPPSKDAVAHLLAAPLRDGGIWQPVFAIRQVTTSITVRSGETVLIGELALENTGPAPSEGERSRQIYVFVTARVEHNPPE